MSLHLVGRNGPEGPQVLCWDEPLDTHYWRAMEISHALDHPTALRFDSHIAAWRAADMHGGVAVAMADYAKYIKPPRVSAVLAEPPALRLAIVPK